jgi:DNA invertase Pin-like site-specific DNA recombinase
MKAVAYLRVSTDLQDARAQRAALERFARERGLELLGIFSDEEVSGSTDFFSRKGVREMLDFCREKGINQVLIYDLTRIGRFDEPERIFDVLRGLSEQGLMPHFVSEPEIADPLLKKFWDFLKSWFATYEKLMIAQRTRYGIQKLRDQGRLYHRPRLEHYYAAWLHSKPLREVSEAEVEAANQALRTLLRRAVREGVKKKYVLAHLASRELAGLYERFPNAPKTYWAARHLFSDGERL